MLVPSLVPVGCPEGQEERRVVATLKPGSHLAAIPRKRFELVHGHGCQFRLQRAVGTSCS